MYLEIRIKTFSNQVIIDIISVLNWNGFFTFTITVMFSKNE